MDDVSWRDFESTDSGGDKTNKSVAISWLPPLSIAIGVEKFLDGCCFRQTIGEPWMIIFIGGHGRIAKAVATRVALRRALLVYVMAVILCLF